MEARHLRIRENMDTDLKTKLNSTKMTYLNKNGKLENILETNTLKAIKVCSSRRNCSTKTVTWLEHVYRMEDDRLMETHFKARGIQKIRSGPSKRSWIEAVETAADSKGIKSKHAKKLALSS